MIYQSSDEVNKIMIWNLRKEFFFINYSKIVIKCSKFVRLDLAKAFSLTLHPYAQMGLLVAK